MKRPEEIDLLDLAKVTSSDVERNHALIQSTGNRVGGAPGVAVWFLPFVDHALKGGVRTVFMFAEHMSLAFGTLNHFVLVSYGNAHHDTKSLSTSLAKHFPELRFTMQSYRLLYDDPNELPYSDCSICTLWTTAYAQLRYLKTRAKFYLVQDFEPLFYSSGDISAVIEQTYRFGFALLVNTEGVAAKLGKYNCDVTQFTPGVDRSVFFPDPNKNAPGNPFRIVFYGRPSNRRNCFWLGLEILRLVKNRLGADVDIVSVGSEWDEQAAGVSGVIRNLGLLKSMHEVAALYRSSDLGLVFMTTPHPSYQPFEYMASGCVVASNINESTSWLLNDTNSLRLTPIPGIAADQICELASDNLRWRNFREKGVIKSRGLDWEVAISNVISRIIL